MNPEVYQPDRGLVRVGVKRIDTESPLVLHHWRGRDLVKVPGTMFQLPATPELADVALQSVQDMECPQTGKLVEPVMNHTQDILRRLPHDLADRHNAQPVAYDCQECDFRGPISVTARPQTVVHPPGHTIRERASVRRLTAGVGFDAGRGVFSYSRRPGRLIVIVGTTTQRIQPPWARRQFPDARLVFTGHNGLAAVLEQPL